MRGVTPLILAVILIALTLVLAFALVSMMRVWTTWSSRKYEYLVFLGDSRIVRWPNGSYTIYLHILNQGNPESFIGMIRLYNRYDIRIENARVCVIRGFVQVTGSGTIYLAPGSEVFLIIDLGETNLIPPIAYKAQIHLYTADGKMYPVMLLIRDTPPAGISQCKQVLTLGG